MDSVTVARSLRGSIGMLAMDWLMAPSTLEAATAAGLPEGLPAYVMGRFGGLGGEGGPVGHSHVAFTGVERK